MIRNPKTDGNEDLIPSDEDMPEDQTATRHVEVDGRKFTINATDPYGLWHIKPDKGRVPAVLEGEFTSPSEAEQAIKAYMAAKNHKVVPIAPDTSVSNQ